MYQNCPEIKQRWLAAVMVQLLLLVTPPCAALASIAPAEADSPASSRESATGPSTSEASGDSLGGTSARERQTIPPPSDRSSSVASPSYLRTITSLAVVVGLIIACAAIVRRLGGASGTIGGSGRAPSGLLEILGRYPIGGGMSLIMLRVDRRVLVLSQSASGRFGLQKSLRTLTELTDPDDVASILAQANDDEARSLGTRFRSMLHRFDEPGDESMAEGVDARALMARSHAASSEGDMVELLRDDLMAAAGQDERSSYQESRDDSIGSLRRRLATLRSTGE